MARRERRRSFTNEEYGDIIYYYGVARGNSELARREYAAAYPGRRVPDTRVFARSLRRIKESGSVRTLNTGIFFTLDPFNWA